MPNFKNFDLLVVPVEDKKSRTESGAFLSVFGICLLIAYCVYTFWVYSNSYEETRVFWDMDEDRDFSDASIACSSDCLVLITSNKLGKRQDPYDSSISGLKVTYVTPSSPWIGSINFWEDIYVMPPAFNCTDKSEDEAGRWYCTAAHPIDDVEILGLDDIVASGSVRYDVTEEIYKRGSVEEITGFAVSNPEEATDSGLTEQGVGQMVKKVYYDYGSYLIEGLPQPPGITYRARRGRRDLPSDASGGIASNSSSTSSPSASNSTADALGASNATEASNSSGGSTPSSSSSSSSSGLPDDGYHGSSDYDWKSVISFFDAVKLYVKPDEYRLVTFSDSCVRHMKTYNTAPEAVAYTAGIGGGMYGTIMLAMGAAKKLVMRRRVRNESDITDEESDKGGGAAAAHVKSTAAFARDLP